MIFLAIMSASYSAPTRSLSIGKLRNENCDKPWVELLNDLSRNRVDGEIDRLLRDDCRGLFCYF
jgi:hypothetical protein